MPTGGGGGGGDSTTTVINQIDDWTKSIREGLINTSQGVLGQEGPWYYPNDLVAPFSPYQLGSQAGFASFATDPSSYRGSILGQQSADLGELAYNYATSPTYLDSLGQALAANSQLLDPRERYVTTNPYLQDAIYAAMQPTAQQFATSIMPQIQSGAVTAGGYGGSRQGIAEGLASGSAISTMGGIASDMAYQNYKDAATRQLMAAGQQTAVANAPIAGLGAAQGALAQGQNAIGMGLSQAYQNLGMLNAAGAEQQQWAQSLINGELQRWLYNNSMPIQKLTLYGNIVNGMGATGSTQSTTMPGASVSPIQMALAGGALGYGLSSMGLFGGAQALTGTSVLSSGLMTGAGQATGLAASSPALAAAFSNPWTAAAAMAAMFVIPSLF